MCLKSPADRLSPVSQSTGSGQNSAGEPSRRAFKAENPKMSHLWLRWLGTQAELLRNYSFGLGGDEESLGFAQQDELSRTYGEEAEDLEVEEQGSPCSLAETAQHIASPKITTWEAAWNVTNAIQVTRGCFEHCGYMG